MAIDRQRRRLLAGGAGGAAAFATLGYAGHEKGATWLTKRWIAQLVRDSLPGVAIDPDSLEAFALEAAHAHPVLRTSERHFGAAWRHVLGMPDDSEAQRQLEREIVSWFLTGSDFFQRPPASKAPVVYAGIPTACGNVFATFREA